LEAYPLGARLQSEVATMTWGKRRALIIGLVILFFIFIVWAMSWSNRVPSNSVLVLQLSGPIEEQRPVDLFSAFGGPTPVLHDYTDAIDTARADPKVAGLVVRIGPLATGWGKLEEIRSHVLEFRKSGKPSICYLGAD
jgi:protease-4